MTKYPESGIAYDKVLGCLPFFPEDNRYGISSRSVCKRYGILHKSVTFTLLLSALPLIGGNDESGLHKYKQASDNFSISSFNASRHSYCERIIYTIVECEKPAEIGCGVYLRFECSIFMKTVLKEKRVNYPLISAGSKRDKLFPEP